MSKLSVHVTWLFLVQMSEVWHRVRAKCVTTHQTCFPVVGSNWAENPWTRTWMIWFVTRPWGSSSLRAWIWSLPYKQLALSAVVGSFGTCSPEVDDWGRGLKCQICLLGEPGFSVSWSLLLLLLEKWRLKLEGAELDAMPVRPKWTASSETVSSKKSSLL